MVDRGNLYARLPNHIDWTESILPKIEAFTITFTGIEAVEILKKAKEIEGVCNGCLTHFPFQNFEVDHVVPKSKGGNDTDENL